MPIHDLMARIRPAGSFTQKAATLKAMTAWYGNYGYDVATVRLEPLSALRKALLHIQGIGPETGDAILLYAFGLPTFVADAYTLRLLSRYPLPMGKTYGEVKSAFEEGLPQDAAIYNRYHALIVINGKYHCKKKPACGGCPLAYSCGKVGLSSLP